jgi:hypothetical protein
MNAPASITTPFEPEGVKRLLDQFVVSQAAELALSGNYASAESLLKDLVQRPDSPAEALDLQARICVQQGRVVEAEGLWRRALGKDPANSATQAALLRLNRMHQRPVWFMTLWPAVLALAVIGISLAAMQFQAGRRRAEYARLEALIKQASDPAAKGGDIGRLSQSMDALKIQQGVTQSQIEQSRREVQGLATTSAGISKTSNKLLAAWSHQNSLVLPSVAPQVAAQGQQVVAPAVSPAPLQLNIQIAGVVALPQDDHWIIGFEEGLFDRDNQFKTGPEALLESVAKKLVQSQEKLVIEIIGTAEDEPSTSPLSEPRGRDVLSLARAQKVAQFMSGLGIFPLGRCGLLRGEAKTSLFQMTPL